MRLWLGYGLLLHKGVIGRGENGKTVIWVLVPIIESGLEYGRTLKHSYI